MTRRHLRRMACLAAAWLAAACPIYRTKVVDAKDEPAALRDDADGSKGGRP